MFFNRLLISAALFALAAHCFADEPIFEGQPLSHWIGLLNRGETEQRILASHALSQLRERAASAVPALIKALRDPNEHVRRNAAAALRHNPEAAAPEIDKLVEVVNRSNLLQSAMETLGAIGPDARAAVPGLLKWLNMDARLYFRDGRVLQVLTAGFS